MAAVVSSLSEAVPADRPVTFNDVPLVAAIVTLPVELIVIGADVGIDPPAPPIKSKLLADIELIQYALPLSD